MEHRKMVKRVTPAQAERVTEILVAEYTCDNCGSDMPQHNATGGFLPSLEGTRPRNEIVLLLNKEHFSGSEDGYQRLSRDYCDLCLPGIWEALNKILAYGGQVPV